MPIKGWENNSEILNAVQDCVIRRLSTEESLQFLDAKGFKMSESKLRRIKRYIRNSIEDRLNYIAYHEYASSHIEAIDTIRTIISRLWEIAKEKKGNREELKALELIPQNVMILEELYDGNPIVASLASKLAEKEGQNVS